MPLLAGLSGEKLDCSGQCFQKIPTMKIVQLICQVVVGLSVVHDCAKHWINRCPVDNRFPEGQKKMYRHSVQIYPVTSERPGPEVLVEWEEFIYF